MRKTSRITIVLAAALFASRLFAQTASIPEVAEVQAKFDEKVRLEVLRPHELAVADLNAKFAAALERAQESAQKAGNLDEAVAVKGEKEAALAGRYTPALDDAKTPASLKTMRSTYRAALGRLELDRDKKLQPLKDAYSKSLEALIVSMTKGGRLEDALVLKKMREDLLANATVKNAASQAGAGTTIDLRGQSFTNSFGMKFVRVPGTKVLFCIHETRCKDYAAYAESAQDVDSTWKDRKNDGGVILDRPEDHPVSRISWEDAQKFCTWLSKKEGKVYRLPTDQEWSYAVGIGRDEKWNKDTTPATVVRNETDFPWGQEWPPTKGAGNYSDLSRKNKAPANKSQYLDEDDGFPTTSPVMSFSPNKLGIYDLGGNVWEWCEDWFDSSKTDRVLRGSSWTHWEKENLRSSYRDHHKPDERLGLGFRIVLVPTP